MLSHKLKAIKPDIVIYEKALNKFDLIPQECVFIDDKLENVKAAKDFGIHSFQHISFQKTKAYLKEKFNILV